MHADAGQGRLRATLERLLTIPALEVKSALDEASTLVATALGADKVDAFLLHPSSATLVAVGASDTPLGHTQHRLGLHRLPLANGGRVVAVFQSGASFRSGHTEDDPEELLGIKRGLGVRSTLAAPLGASAELPTRSSPPRCGRPAPPLPLRSTLGCGHAPPLVQRGDCGVTAGGRGG